MNAHRIPIRLPLPIVLVLGILLGGAAPLAGQAVLDGPVELTPESMVELALSNSYQVRYLNMGVEQTRQRLRAQRARLRSSVSLDITAPTFESISEEVYDSNLGRNLIVRENSRRWQAGLSVRQPVILFGYPTNGYLSLNNRMYRYTQYPEGGGRDINYYNRYFVQYTQPLFQPNSLRNNLEEAELNLENAQLGFYRDMISLVDDASDDFYDLFEIAYEEVITGDYVANLEAAVETARRLVAADSARQIELDQVQVELGNARERVQRARTDFRLEMASLKTRLSLAASDSLYLVPELDLRPVEVDPERATRFAMELTPRLRSLEIQKRENEINLDETRGRNAFRVDLEFTYGREMRDPQFRELWGEPSNTYTIEVDARIPIWDWGERNANIEASRISLERTMLRMEEAEGDIVTSVQNQVQTVQELQSRALTLQQNLELARGISRQNLDRYAAGTVAIQDVLQSFRSELTTAENLADAFLGWRNALLRLQMLTYFDFEYDMPVLERFGIDAAAAGRGGFNQ
jgi:outer membrane protein